MLVADIRPQKSVTGNTGTSKDVQLFRVLLRMAAWQCYRKASPSSVASRSAMRIRASSTYA